MHESLYVLEMSKKIEKTAACEIRAVVRFLNAKGTTAAEIYSQICDVYGEGAMSDLMVRRWVGHCSTGMSYQTRRTF